MTWRDTLPPTDDRDTLVDSVPAGFLYLVPLRAPSPAIISPSLCPDCGAESMGSADYHDGKAWRSRAACCGAERDALGCRLDGAL